MIIIIPKQQKSLINVHIRRIQNVYFIFQYFANDMHNVAARTTQNIKYYFIAAHHVREQLSLLLSRERARLVWRAANARSTAARTKVIRRKEFMYFLLTSASIVLCAILCQPSKHFVYLQNVSSILFASSSVVCVRVLLFNAVDVKLVYFQRHMQ